MIISPLAYFGLLVRNNSSVLLLAEHCSRHAESSSEESTNWATKVAQKGVSGQCRPGKSSSFGKRLIKLTFYLRELIIYYWEIEESERTLKMHHFVNFYSNLSKNQQPIGLSNDVITFSFLIKQYSKYQLWGSCCTMDSLLPCDLDQVSWVWFKKTDECPTPPLGSAHLHPMLPLQEWWSQNTQKKNHSFYVLKELFFWRKYWLVSLISHLICIKTWITREIYKFVWKPNANRGSTGGVDAHKKDVSLPL